MKRAGYTLIEVLVSIAPLFLTLAALAGVSRVQSRLFERESRSLALREASRRVLDMMEREIREAGFDPLEAGSFDGIADGVSIAATDRIEVRADHHGATSADPPDGALDLDSDERIAFFRGRSRQTVYESVGEQVLPLTSGVVIAPLGLRFRYLDACNREIVTAADGELSDPDRPRVRRVAITLVVTDPATGERLEARRTVTLRNRSPECAA